MQSEVYILKGGPPLCQSTHLDIQKRVLTEAVHQLLPNSQVQRVCSISPGTESTSTTAVVELAKESLTQPSAESPIKMQHAYSCSVKATFEFQDAKVASIFYDILKEYPELKYSPGEKHSCVIFDSLENIIAIRDVFNDRIATLDPSLELTAAALPSKPTSQSVYENHSPDALALLEKLPEGSIDGVHYDWRTGRVFIDKDPPSKEDERISKFQNAYQGIVGNRKLKIECIPIPTGVLSDALGSVIHRYNATYNQCVFFCQEEEDRVVKIVSTSSRQIDQAKKFLADELAKTAVAVAAPSKSTSTTEVILLSDDRKLTLKKADIVKEDVDMIVNPANKRLLHGGGVAGALNRASNGQLQKYSDRYAKKKGQVPVGSVVVTLGGGALKCKHVIHAVGPDSTSYSQADCKRLLNQVIGEVLKSAERHNASSIAIPAISTGIFGVKKELVARCVTDTIIAYYFSKPHPVASDIRIVIVDEPTYAPFARYFEQKRKTLDTSKHAHRPLIQPAKFVPPPVSERSKSSPSLPSTPPISEGHQFEGSSPVGPVSKGLVQGLPERKLGLRDDLTKLGSLLEGLAGSWQRLGLLLGFPNDTLEQIASTPSDPRVYVNKILMNWLSGDVDSPTVAVLVKALTTMSGMEDIIRNILEVYGDSNDEAAKKPSPGQEDGTNDLDSISWPKNLQPPLEPEPADSADKNSIGSDKPVAATSGGPQSTFSDPLTTQNDLNPSGDSPEPITTVSSGAEVMVQGQTTEEFKQAVYDQSSSASGVPCKTSKSMTTSLSVSLTSTTAASHPLQTATTTAAVSSTPPGFFGHDLSSSSSGMGEGGQPTGRGHHHYSQAGGQSTGGAKAGGKPTGGGQQQYSQASGQSTGGGHQQYSQAGGQSTGRGHQQYSQAGGHPTGWGTPQTSWVDTSSGGGVNNVHTAANTGQPGAQHNSMGGGDQPNGAQMNYSHAVSGASQGANGGMQYGSGYGSDGGMQYGSGYGNSGGMQYGSGYGNNVVTSQPGPQDQWSTGKWRDGNEKHPGSNSGHGNQGYPNPTPTSGGGTSHGVSKQESKEDECPICLSDFTNPVQTKCGHVFCNHCITEALQHSPYCPTCKAALRPIVGNQPVGGTMNVQYSRSPLPGNQGYGTIVIEYHIPNGLQTKEHPNPGQRFTGTSRRAYLPCSPEGQEVLRLLQKAFNARLIFTVGTSVTSGQSNVVVWNDIHHKTNTSGGQQGYGYPDPTYLQRVKEDLAAKGIVPEDNTSSVV